MIAALQMRLPDLDPAGAVGIAEAQDALAKYNYDPGEPRDERGRWTTGGAASSASNAPRPPSTPQFSPIGDRRHLSSARSVVAGDGPSLAAPSERSWGGPVHPYGGHLIQTQGGGVGGNGPPEDIEPTVAEPPRPEFPTLRAPLGWGMLGHTAGGLEYPPVIRPMLPSGQPWPPATHDLIKKMLGHQPGKLPTMLIYVPLDGRGPILVGSTPEGDLPPEPPGYDEVRLIGTPQVTYSGATETGHARDSIDEMLRVARYNEFQAVLFNRSIVMASRYIQEPKEYLYESIVRPDVVFVARPSVDLPFRLYPYESLSPGQNAPARAGVLGQVPGLGVMNSNQYYKALVRFSPEWCRRLGVRRLCL
jgi:hypothetical protein